MGSYCEWNQKIRHRNVIQLDISTERLVAKAEPRAKLVVNLSSNQVPINERMWIKIDPKPFNQGCFAVSKFMITLLRHDASIPREDDGAVRFDDLIEMFKVKFVGNLQWTVDAWVNFLAKGGEKKKQSTMLESLCVR